MWYRCRVVNYNVMELEARGQEPLIPASVLANLSSPIQGVETMFWLKSCPRCQGDLYDSKDIYGSYIDCFQCGHYLTAEEDAQLRSDNVLPSAYSVAPVVPTRTLAKTAA